MPTLKFEVGEIMRAIIAHVEANPDANLMLAKDQGIYICPVPCPSKDHVLYAAGCAPLKCDDGGRIDDHCRALLGNDDFAVRVQLEWLRMAVDFRWRFMHVLVDGDMIMLVNGNGAAPPAIFGGQDGK